MYDLVGNLKQALLDTDADEQEAKFKESGLVPVCRVCGEVLTGFPLGARVDDPLCDDCREELEVKAVQEDVNLPPIGQKTDMVFQETTTLIVPE